jgi:hypothetical protein
MDKLQARQFLAVLNTLAYNLKALEHDPCLTHDEIDMYKAITKKEFPGMKWNEVRGFDETDDTFNMYENISELKTVRHYLMPEIGCAVWVKKLGNKKIVMVQAGDESSYHFWMFR